MDKNFKIQSGKLLAVEGKDECNFFNALFKHMNIEGVQELDIGGKDQFPNMLPLLMSMEGFGDVEVIGFVRDAEDQMAKRAFQSIARLLKKYHFPYSSWPDRVSTERSPVTGIFIMPDNTNAGMLEDLCLQTVALSPVYACVEDFVNCFIPYLSEQEKSIYNDPKSQVQAYLATKPPLVNSLGLGAQKGHWNFDHPCLNEIKAFLQQLFA